MYEDVKFGQKQSDVDNIGSLLIIITYNRKDLTASNLVGLHRKNPVLDPPDVSHLNNQLYMNAVYLSI